MAGLKAIQLKIRSVKKTKKVTKAMEAVSAAKMRKAQQRALMGRAYAKAAAAVLSRVSGSRELKSHPLTRGSDLFASEKSSGSPQTISSANKSFAKALYIVITSDKGLAGALNSAVLRGAAAHMSERGLKPEAVTIIAVGRKANDFFASRGFKVEKYYPNTGNLDTMLIDELVKSAASAFGSSAVDMVTIAYQNFVSTFEQRPTVRTIFPLSLEELQKVVADIVPARGVFADTKEESRPEGYTIEPGEAEVYNAILPRLASIFVYHALLESQASEHSARMVAMKSASDKAGEVTNALTLKFNKARQASITREVSEITGGMEAMSTQ